MKKTHTKLCSNYVSKTAMNVTYIYMYIYTCHGYANDESYDIDEYCVGKVDIFTHSVDYHIGIARVFLLP